MSEPAAVSPAVLCAQVLVDELTRGGVRDVVLSPGSRSAPLAYALAAADRAGRLRLHVRIDERTAGFLALGLAKASRTPTVVVTTSGTATANLHPAVLEASHSGVPLLVLTADRPAELLGVGANQTIDQVGLYGSAVRAALAIPAPDDREGQPQFWRSTVCRALAAASGALSGEPGPVHLNVALREPLVPDQLAPELPGSAVGRADGGPWLVAARSQDVDPELYAGAPRTLVVVGDCSPELRDRARRVVAASGWPVVAEPSSGLGAEALPLALLGSDALLARWTPQRVLVVGRPTLSRRVTDLLRRPGLVVDVLSESQRFFDVAHTTGSVLLGEIEVLGRSDPEFAAAWSRAAAAAQSVSEHMLTQQLSGPSVAAALADHVAPAGLLVVGSSNPVRDLAAVSWRIRPTALVLANRGVAGIDGTVSTAVGAALAVQAENPGQSYALMGDLTFLHDSNGLVIGPGEPRPDLCIVVVNDDGGGIFSLLEQGDEELAAPFERVFGTPHGTDLAALCAATRTPHVLAPDVETLRAALQPGPGLRVVEVPLDRGARRASADALVEAIEHAIAAGLAET